MSTTLATRKILEVSSRQKGGMVGVFYLLTFLMGGLFLFVGGKLGFVVELTAAMFYIAMTVVFYSVSKSS
jgi:hypothetical protein